jgi:hypothetical protein
VFFFRFPAALQVNLGGNFPEGQFPQLIQIDEFEKVRQRGSYALLGINFPLPQPFQQILRRQVHVHQFIRLEQHGIGDALMDLHPDLRLHDSFGPR